MYAKTLAKMSTNERFGKRTFKIDHLQIETFSKQSPCFRKEQEKIGYYIELNRITATVSLRMLRKCFESSKLDTSMSSNHLC